MLGAVAQYRSLRAVSALRTENQYYLGLILDSILKYKFGQKIGEGTFAQVYIGACNDEQVAFKVLQKESLKTDRDKFRVNKEIELLNKVNHPNIVKMKEIVEDQESLYLITEYVSGGELFYYIVEQQKYIEQHSQSYNWKA